MPNGYSRILRKTPPFRHLYEQLDEEQRECTELTRQLKEKEKENRQLQREKEYYYCKSLTPDQYPAYLKDWYFRQVKEELDLEHPRGYNQKIQWLKLYDSTPLKNRLTDKYRVRDWVSEKIGPGYLVPLLGVYDTFDDIDFDGLPDCFVIKTNHACKNNRIVRNKSKFNREKAREKFNLWMSRDYAYWFELQMQYAGIPRKILVEEYLENEGGSLDDYKVFCFDGRAEYVMVEKGRNKDLKKVIFDREWKRMPFLDGDNWLDESVAKPDNLDELLRLSEILSEGFYHVRVDFYRLDDGTLKFGEMTFTPTSGRVLFKPAQYEQMLGDLIHLPTDER